MDLLPYLPSRPLSAPLSKENVILRYTGDYLRGPGRPGFGRGQMDGNHVVVAEPRLSVSLAQHGLRIESSDQPERWPVRVRTGLVMLAVGEDGPRAGLAVLAALNPDGADAASLTEHDLWARLTLESGNA